MAGRCRIPCGHEGCQPQLSFSTVFSWAAEARLSCAHVCPHTVEGVAGSPFLQKQELQKPVGPSAAGLGQAKPGTL